MKGLPEGWTTASGAEVFEFVTSGSRGWAQYYSDSGASFIRMGNLDHGTIALDLNEVQCVRPPEGAEGDRTRLRANDILISITAELGMIGLVPSGLGEAYINQHIALARPVPWVDARFLAWYLASEEDGKNQLQSLQRGATKVGLGLEDIRNLRFPLAPLAEQKRIVDKLDGLLARVGACRERLERIPAFLKRFRQSVLAAATSGELTKEWREEQGRTHAWTESRIEQIASVGTGSTPLRTNSAFFADSGTPWITSAMTGLPVVTRSYEFVTDAAIAAHRLRKYPIGTLIVAMYGEGKTRGQVTELRIEATINQACAAILVDESKATAAYVKLALESNYLQMRALAEGGNQPNLNLSKIKEFPLSLPPLDEQRGIVERVEAIWDWLSRAEARFGDAQRLVESLTRAALAKAFRGELVPQDPRDEPAAALLARHRATPAATPARRPRTPRAKTASR